MNVNRTIKNFGRKTFVKYFTKRCVQNSSRGAQPFSRGN